MSGAQVTAHAEPQAGAAAPLDLDAIEARAKDASFEAPGPWTAHDDGVNSWVSTPLARGHCIVQVTREMAEHIAGMHPTTTLALVEELRRLRALLADVRRELPAAVAKVEDGYGSSDLRDVCALLGVELIP